VIIENAIQQAKMRRWETKSGYNIFQVLSGRSNVFLLTNGKTNILTDTSVARAWNKFQKNLNHLNIKTIDYLILTHAHFDHAANAQKIKSMYNSKIFIQKEEASFLEYGDNVLPKGTNNFTRPIINILGKRIIHKLRYKPCKADFLVDSDYDLKGLGFNAYLTHTPGHTIGSMSLIIDDEIAIVGDTMFGVFNWSAFPPYAQDEGLMLKSWAKLLETNCIIFIPSHGTANRRELVQKCYNRKLKSLL
jgi:hydroxyacylglutathione hydrolase